MTQTLTLDGTTYPVRTDKLSIGDTHSWSFALSLTHGPGVFSLAFVRAG